MLMSQRGLTPLTLTPLTRFRPPSHAGRPLDRMDPPGNRHRLPEARPEARPGTQSRIRRHRTRPCRL